MYACVCIMIQYKSPKKYVPNNFSRFVHSVASAYSCPVSVAALHSDVSK